MRTLTPMSTAGIMAVSYVPASFGPKVGNQLMIMKTGNSRNCSSIIYTYNKDLRVLSVYEDYSFGSAQSLLQSFGNHTPTAEWNDEEQSVYIHEKNARNGNNIVIPIGKENMIVMGEKKKLTSKARIQNKRVFLPLIDIYEALGLSQDNLQEQLLESSKKRMTQLPASFGAFCSKLADYPLHTTSIYLYYKIA